MLTLYRPGLPTFRSRFFPGMTLFNEDPQARSPETACWRPNVDIRGEDGRFTLTAEFPGMTNDDVHVDVRDGVLTLSGKKKSEVEEEKDGYTYKERSYGSFERSFTLPTGTPVDEIDAKLENGVLTVTIPVVEETAKKIDVKAA